MEKGGLKKKEKEKKARVAWIIVALLCVLREGLLCSSFNGKN